MTKEELNKALKQFIDSHYLKEVLSNDEFSLFNFCNKVYVGFSHQKTEAHHMHGLLLTQSDAAAISRSNELFHKLFDLYTDHQVLELHALAFNDELYSDCQTQNEKKRLDKILKKMGYQNCMSLEVSDEAEPISDTELQNHKLKEHLVRRLYSEKARKLLKRAIHATALFLSLLTIAFLVFVTIDLRESLDPIKTPADFDKNGEEGVYSAVEVDFLALIKTISYDDYDSDGSYSSGYDQYYLFGNSQTKQFGIVKFEKHTFIDDLLEASKDCSALPEPIRLYGVTRDMPSFVSAQNEFDNRIKDYSEDAFGYFLDKIAPIDRSSDLGSVYISASSEPTHETALINQIIGAVGWICMCGSLIAIFTAIYFAFKHDMIEKCLAQINAGRF